MLFSMVCWGSWANSFSLARGKYRFELFFWDYAFGIMLGVLVFSAMLGPGSSLFHGTMDPGKAASLLPLLLIRWRRNSSAVARIGSWMFVGYSKGFP
jgi:hypothetical protein